MRALGARELLQCRLHRRVRAHEQLHGELQAFESIFFQKAAPRRQGLIDEGAFEGLLCVRLRTRAGAIGALRLRDGLCSAGGVHVGSS